MRIIIPVTILLLNSCLLYKQFVKICLVKRNIIILTFQEILFCNVSPILKRGKGNFVYYQNNIFLCSALKITLLNRIPMPQACFRQCKFYQQRYPLINIILMCTNKEQHLSLTPVIFFPPNVNLKGKHSAEITGHGNLPPTTTSDSNIIDNIY